MSLARDGYPVMGLSLALAIGVIAASVWRRSWFLWLLGCVLLVIALGVAWYFRAPHASSPGTALTVMLERAG